MYKTIDIGNLVGHSLSERDRRTLLLNSWTPIGDGDWRWLSKGVIDTVSILAVTVHRYLQEVQWS